MSFLRFPLRLDAKVTSRSTPSGSQLITAVFSDAQRITVVGRPDESRISIRRRITQLREREIPK